MVKKQREMNECGVASAQEEKGRKNKRKLADPSLASDSLTQFPPYDLHSLNDSEAESLSLGWECDDPFACYIQELLSTNLLTLIRTAMNHIVYCGYSEDVVLKPISGSKLYCRGDDLISNIVTDTIIFLKSGEKKVPGLRDYVFEDLQQIVAYTLVEKIRLVREVKPSLSAVEAMWRLLMCDLNCLQASELEGDECNQSETVQKK